MASRQDAFLRGGLAASLLLHVLAGIILLPLIPARPLPPPAETSVDVEIVDPPATAPPANPSATPPDQAASPLPAIDELRFAAPAPVSPAVPQAMAPTPPPAQSPQIPNPVPPASAPASRRIRTTDMLSGKILSDPRSRDAVRQLRQLAPSDQIEQLCNVEAMEQVHRWKSSYVPEFVVAYAKADTVQSATEIDAPGAAFLSARHWFEISFHCVVSADLSKVSAFDFEVGPEIPPEQWAAYSLFASSKAQD